MADFIYAYDLDGGERRTKVFKSAGAVKPNVIGALTASGTVTQAASGATGGILGVTVDVASGAGQEVEVIMNRRAVFRCEYKGGTLTDANLGTEYDYDPTDNKLDVSDTTDGFLTLVAYNENYAWVMIAPSVRAL